MQGGLEHTGGCGLGVGLPVVPYYKGHPFCHLWATRLGVAECCKEQQEIPLASVGEYC